MNTQHLPSDPSDPHLTKAEKACIIYRYREKPGGPTEAEEAIIAKLWKDIEKIDETIAKEEADARERRKEEARIERNRKARAERAEEKRPRPVMEWTTRKPSAEGVWLLWDRDQQCSAFELIRHEDGVLRDELGNEVLSGDEIEGLWSSIPVSAIEWNQDEFMADVKMIADPETWDYIQANQLTPARKDLRGDYNASAAWLIKIERRRVRAAAS